ncbi:acyl carrier protein [Auriculariales sp. MPI-PUGE-AT-0066]|nr:acyl carrier protein [Auriculariales sp. MPI-PUGE-AT-0066]
MLAFRASLRSVARPLATRTLQRPAGIISRLQIAGFASGAGPDKDQIQARILDVLKSFEKVDPAKLTTGSSFANDLGLDSLDAVEVVMAIEEEFNIEIPDAEADAITTVQQAIDYIGKTPEAQ